MECACIKLVGLANITSGSGFKGGLIEYRLVEGRMVQRRYRQDKLTGELWGD